MRIDVWSDIACPWCYLGKHRLDAALVRLGGVHEVVFRAYQLDPRAPATYDDGLTHSERIAKKLRMPPEQLAAMHDRMIAMGREVGVDFHFERVRGGNTFDAHRVVRLARERALQGAVKERMLKAYFDEGVAIGDRDQLARLGADAGLDAAEVQTMLGGDALAGEVQADEAAARTLGVSGVPFFLLGGVVAVPGAQSIDALVQALGEAQDKLAATP